MPRRSLIGDLPATERPRERLLEQGSRALSEAELVAVLLRTGASEGVGVRLRLPGLPEDGDEPARPGK